VSKKGDSLAEALALSLATQKKRLHKKTEGNVIAFRFFIDG
jgi:hypothetical protein